MSQFHKQWNRVATPLKVWSLKHRRGSTFGWGDVEGVGWCQMRSNEFACPRKGTNWAVYTAQITIISFQVISYNDLVAALTVFAKSNQLLMNKNCFHHTLSLHDCWMDDSSIELEKKGPLPNRENAFQITITPSSGGANRIQRININCAKLILSWRFFAMVSATRRRPLQWKKCDIE